MKKLISILFLLLFSSSVFAAKLYVGGERVIFACKMVKGLLQEDKQAKYGIRLLKIIE